MIIVQVNPIKRKAIRLRRRGYSYALIKNKLGVSKSTLSCWLKRIKLSNQQHKALYTKQVRILINIRKKRQLSRVAEIGRIIATAKEEARNLFDKEGFKLMGAALYWAEGTKGDVLEITNSDPSLVFFMTRWFRDVFNVEVKLLKARLNIHAGQNDKKIKKFWSDLTGIPFDNFGKSYIKPKGSGFRKNKLYYGTIKIVVPKSTDMKHKVFGLVQGALEMVGNEYVTRRWERLKKNIKPVNLVE